MPIHGVTAVYKPFSFQERLAPLQMMKEEYDKVGEAIANYSDDSNAYYNYLDPKSRAIVDKYNETLGSVADSLSRDGLKSVSRNTLYDLKRMYNNQIAPINKAAESYASLQEQLRKAKFADPSLLVGKVPTVSDLMENPDAIPSMVSGETLYKAGIAAASQIPNLTYDQIMSGNIPNLEEVINSVASAYGVDDIDSVNGRAQILRGVTAGVSAMAKDLETERAKLEIKDEYSKREFNRRAWLEQQDRDALMLRNGFVRDSKAPGGYRFDSSLAAATSGRTTPTSGGKTSNPLTDLLSGNDKVWGTSRIVLGRERDTVVKNFVDKKTGKIDIADGAFDENGYYHLPETEASRFPGMYDATASKTVRDPKQVKLYDLLSQYYTDDELVRMTRRDIESAVRSLAEEANLDGQQTNQYRWNLKPEDTKAFISSVGKGKKFKEVKRRGEDGNYVYKSGTDINDPDKGSSHLYYDANNNTILLQYDDTYYKVPMSVVSSEYLDALQTITAPGKDGLSYLRRTQIDISDVQARIQDLDDEYRYCQEHGYAVREDLIPERNQKYNELLELLNELAWCDSIMSSLGNHIMTYTGSRNLNTK